MHHPTIITMATPTPTPTREREPLDEPRHVVKRRVAERHADAIFAKCVPSPDEADKRVQEYILSDKDPSTYDASGVLKDVPEANMDDILVLPDGPCGVATIRHDSPIASSSSEAMFIAALPIRDGKFVPGMSSHARLYVTDLAHILSWYAELKYDARCLARGEEKIRFLILLLRELPSHALPVSTSGYYRWSFVYEPLRERVYDVYMQVVGMFNKNSLKYGDMYLDCDYDIAYATVIERLVAERIGEYELTGVELAFKRFRGQKLLAMHPCHIASLIKNAICAVHVEL